MQNFTLNVHQLGHEELWGGPGVAHLAEQEDLLRDHPSQAALVQGLCHGVLVAGLEEPEQLAGTEGGVEPDQGAVILGGQAVLVPGVERLQVEVELALRPLQSGHNQVGESFFQFQTNKFI